MASHTLFKGINAIILEPGLGKARKKILRKKLEEKGGVSSETLSSSVTHVLVGGNVKYSRIPTLLKATEIDKNVQILQADWISKCLTEDKLVGTDTYRVTPCNDTEAVSLLTSDNKQSSVAAAGAAVVEQQTTESHQTTPTKQLQHFTSPVKGSPAKKSSAHGKLVVDSDDSDYVDSDDERCDAVTTGNHDVTTDPPPAKKFKVLNLLTCYCTCTPVMQWLYVIISVHTHVATPHACTQAHTHLVTFKRGRDKNSQSRPPHHQCTFGNGHGTAAWNSEETCNLM